MTDESREASDIETTETAEAVADDPDEAENEVGESVTEAPPTTTLQDGPTRAA